MSFIFLIIQRNQSAFLAEETSSELSKFPFAELSAEKTLNVEEIIRLSLLSLNCILLRFHFSFILAPVIPCTQSLQIFVIRNNFESSTVISTTNTPIFDCVFLKIAVVRWAMHISVWVQELYGFEDREKEDEGNVH